MDKANLKTRDGKELYFGDKVLTRRFNNSPLIEMTVTKDDLFSLMMVELVRKV